MSKFSFNSMMMDLDSNMKGKNLFAKQILMHILVYSKNIFKIKVFVNLITIFISLYTKKN